MTDNAEKELENELQEEGLLQSAVAKTMQAYNAKATADNLRNWTAAKQALEVFTKKQQAQAKPTAQRFESILEVLDYLKAEGWKVSKSKLYEDQNKIDRQKDGSMLKKDVDRYAALLLSRLDGSELDGMTGDAQRKAKADADKAEEDAKKAKFQNEVAAGMYILKSEVEQQLAARAAYLKSNLGTEFIHGRASEIIRIAGGQQDQAPELIDYWLQQVAEVFDYYAKPLQFSVAYAAVKETEE